MFGSFVWKPLLHGIQTSVLSFVEPDTERCDMAYNMINIDLTKSVTSFQEMAKNTM